MFLVYIYVTARNVKALTARNVYILMFYIYDVRAILVM